MSGWRIKDVIDALPGYPREEPLRAPVYRMRPGKKIVLAVPSQENHTSNEAHQLVLGLKHAGYQAYGHGWSTVDVADMLEDAPAVAFVQDQHEWDNSHLPPDAPAGHLARSEEKFRNSELLASVPNVFKVTVVKDTHRQYESAKRYSQAIGCHAWVCFYATEVVLHTLSWILPKHLIRTWHTVDASSIPSFSANRAGCILSGSLGGAYPLRTRIHDAKLPEVFFLQHPGYVSTKCHTNDYLKKLSKHRVSIATASRFGYCLRKIIESVACGCAVITDLPEDEKVPGIDDGLTRVHPNIGMDELRKLVKHLADHWDADRQRLLANVARDTFDFRVMGARLVADIDKLRKGYGCT